MGEHKLGPQDGTLSVRTGRTGAVAKAGHDLLMTVTAWEATLGDTALELRADATSLRVREGSGGMKALDDDDKANIHQTIDDEVLKRQDIVFRSTELRDGGDTLHVAGDLTLMGRTRPLAFDLHRDGDRLTGRAVVKQTEWGMKPYSALFGTLKVADAVAVEVDVTIQPR
jgi:YceI-like protein